MKIYLPYYVAKASRLENSKNISFYYKILGNIDKLLNELQRKNIKQIAIFSH